jgi:protein O-GlcNAc transferase
MNKLEQLKQILDTALQGAGKSKLTEDVIGRVGGFISPNNRHLFNNLGSISTHYLECGSHVGSSLISTVYGNDNLKSAIGIDNFSLFDEGQNAKRDFLSHCETFISQRYKLLEKDYFQVTKEEIGEPIDLYLFDGSHDYESQKKGVTYYAPFFAAECILVVDDFDWDEPQQGTWDGIREAGLKIKYAMTLSNGVRSSCSETGYWNGLLIALITK